MLTETRQRLWDGTVEREKYNRLQRWRVFSVVAVAYNRSLQFSDARQGCLLDYTRYSELYLIIGVNCLVDSINGAEASLTLVY